MGICVFFKRRELFIEKKMPEPHFEWNGTDYVTEDNVPIVWVDGSCLRNGTPDAKSGIGWWADPNDKKWRVNHKYPDTNQFVEIFAAEDAIRTFKKRGYKHIQVRSDSNYLIDCMHKYVPKWIENGWVTTAGHEAVHREALENILQLERSIDVEYVWIPRSKIKKPTSWLELLQITPEDYKSI